MSEYSKPETLGVNVDTTDETLYPHVQFQECFVKKLDAALYPYTTEPTLLKEYVAEVTKVLVDKMVEHGVDALVLNFSGSGDSADEVTVTIPGSDCEDSPFLRELVEVFDYVIETNRGHIYRHSPVAMNSIPESFDIKFVLEKPLVQHPVQDVARAVLAICLNHSYGYWFNDDGSYGTVTLNRLGQIFIEINQVTVTHDYKHFSVLN